MRIASELNLRLPVCSIIIPIFNRQKTIIQTVESCMAQDYPGIEVILVDDGSTDESASICMALETASLHVGKSIRFVRQANAGACAARNRGMATATGDFLLFLDSDDLIPPNKISTQIAAMERNLADCCICDFMTVDPSGKLIEIFRNNLSPADFIRKMRSPSNSAIVMRRSSVPVEMQWNTSLRRMQDFDFMLRYLSGVRSWAYVPEPLYFYVIHDGARISDSYINGMPYGTMFCSMARHLYNNRTGTASRIDLLTHYALALMRAELKDKLSKFLPGKVKALMKRFLRA